MPNQLRRLAARIACFTGVAWATFSPVLWAEPIPHVLIVGPLDNYGALVGGVLESIHSAGFTDATHVRIDLKSAKSADEAKDVIGAAAAAGDLSAIVTVFGQATNAASAASTTIPIVFCPVADPVASKFAVSEEAPGKNLTGVASADAEVSRRRLAAFRTVLPQLKRLVVLFDSGFPPDRTQVKNLEEVAPASEIALVSKAIDDEAAAVTALRTLAKSDGDAILILKESMLRGAGDDLKAAAGQQKLPLLVGDPDLVEFPGTVAAVGPNQKQVGTTCGALTARILKGAKPGTIPIEHPEFELLVNLKAAQHLGITVPAKALKQAVKVVR